LHGFLGMWRNW